VPAVRHGSRVKPFEMPAEAGTKRRVTGTRSYDDGCDRPTVLIARSKTMRLPKGTRSAPNRAAAGFRRRRGRVEYPPANVSKGGLDDHFAHEDSNCGQAPWRTANSLTRPLAWIEAGSRR